MSTTWKNATMKAIIDFVLCEMMFKTTGDQLYLDENTQLSPKIAEMIAAINARAKKEYVDEAIAKLEENISKTSGIEELTASIKAEMEQYTRTEISKLVNGAPNTLDTLGEISAAMLENADVVEALEKAIGSKITEAEANTLVNVLRNELRSQISTLSQNLSGHISNKSNPHGISKSTIGLSNVDNTADKDKSVKYATNAGTAMKATQDGNGKDIAATYATKDEVKAFNEGMQLYVAGERPEDMIVGDIWFNTKGR